MLINQNSKVNDGILKELLKTSGVYSAYMDIESIKDDIARVEAYLERIDKSKTDKNLADRVGKKFVIKSYKNILSYLKSILVYSYKYDDYKINIRFKSDNSLAKSVGIATSKIYEPKLGVGMEFLDYMSLKTLKEINVGKVVRVKFNSVISALALELCKEDLGYTIKDIEDHISNIDLISENDGSLLDCFLNPDKEEYGRNFARFASELKIEESEYYYKSEKRATSYFLDNIYNFSTYAEVVSMTSKKLVSIVLQAYLYKMQMSKSLTNKYKVLAVYEDEVVIGFSGSYLNEDNQIVSSIDNDDVMKELDENLTVVVFGRKFKFKPQITEYSFSYNNTTNLEEVG